MVTRFLTVFLLLLGSLSAAEPLSLGELVDVALQNQPSTRQAWWNAKRAAAAVGSAKSGYYPKLDFQASVLNGRDFKFINGPDTHYTILGADVLLSMMLYDFGETSASVKAAKMALEEANWQSDWAIQKVMVDVLENAYSVLDAQEVLQAGIFSLEDAERMLSLAVELNRAGVTPVSDVYISKAAFAQMKMELTQSKSQLAIRNGKLAASLGLSPDVELQLAPIGNPQTLPLQKTGELISFASSQRADLMGKRAALEKSLANQAKIASLYSPKLKFAGKGGANHAVNDKANAMQYDVALTLDVPLFTGFDAMYQKRMAFADAQLSREELSQLELDISLEVLTYSRLLQEAQEMMPDAEEVLTNSLKAYESILEIYQAGKEKISAVSDVQRQLAAARVRYSDVKTRWLVSQAKLAYATGTMGSICEENP